MDAEDLKEQRWKGDAAALLIQAAWVERKALSREQFQVLAEGCEFLREWAESMVDEAWVGTRGGD